VVTDSSTQKLRVKCKDPNCEWRLYAKIVDNSWAIMKCPYQHICRVTAARVDHAQLTAKMQERKDSSSHVLAVCAV
jgi:hypothetical protein